MIILTFEVLGSPVAQGSMIAISNKRGGRPMLKYTNESDLKAWRKRVERAARFAAATVGGFPKIDRALGLSATFWLERPISVTRVYPTVPPDLDKMVRAIGDALSGIVYQDDKQLTTISAIKRYAAGFPPCAVLEITQEDDE